jgi:hypothetical protein
MLMLIAYVDDVSSSSPGVSMMMGSIYASFFDPLPPFFASPLVRLDAGPEDTDFFDGCFFTPAASGILLPLLCPRVGLWVAHARGKPLRAVKP